jgi:hypothetical protein
MQERWGKSPPPLLLLPPHANERHVFHLRVILASTPARADPLRWLRFVLSLSLFLLLLLLRLR